MSTSQENTTSDVINNLTPGAQYRVVVYHTNGPLISPPSEPVIIDIGGLSIYIVLVSFILSWLLSQFSVVSLVVFHQNTISLARPTFGPPSLATCAS